MKIRVKKLGASKEYDFMDGKLSIRQFPASMSNVEGTADGFVRIKGTMQLDAFKHCLTGWSGFTDEESGDPIKLTDQVKQGLFDYPDPELTEDGVQLVQFVLRKGKVIAEAEEEAEGN